MTEVKVMVDDEGHDVDAVFEEQIEIGGISGGLSEEEVKEIVKEETKDLPTDIGVSVDETTYEFTIELKDKDGNVVSETKVNLPISNPDLSAFVKNTDKASSSSYGVMRTYHNQWSSGLTFIQEMLAVYAAEKSAIDAKVNTTCPIVPFNIDYAWKVSATTNTETFTDDEQKSARDLIGAVGNTDYATNQKAGIVQAGGYQFGISAEANGFLALVQATNGDIEAKTNNSKPITPKNLDYATMKALSDCKDTTLWTDENKTKALELLGAVKAQNPEFDSGATRGYVYFIDPNGNQIVKKVQIQATADTIPLRNPNGNFYVGNPTLSYECVNKGYVDNLPDKLTLTDDEQAKWRGMIGATKLYLHTYTDSNENVIKIISTSSEEITNFRSLSTKNNIISVKINGYTSLYEIGYFDYVSICHVELNEDEAKVNLKYTNFYFEEITTKSITEL